MVLTCRSVRSADDLVGVPLGADEEDGLSDTADPEREGRARLVPVDFDFIRLVWLHRGVLADEGLVLAGGGVGVVEEVELLDETVWAGVLVVVARRVTWERIDGDRGADDVDVGVCRVDGIVEHWEAVRGVGGRATSKVVLVGC